MIADSLTGFSMYQHGSLRVYVHDQQALAHISQ